METRSSLELKFKAIVSFFMWVLGIELESSPRVSAPKGWTSPLMPLFECLLS